MKGTMKNNIKVTDQQFKNFIIICEEKGELLFGDDEFLREQLNSLLNIQGYWCGLRFRYYLFGEDWTVEQRAWDAKVSVKSMTPP